MWKRPTHLDVKDTDNIKETLFDIRIELASKNKSLEFKMIELKKVLKISKLEKAKTLMDTFVNSLKRVWQETI